MTGEFGCDLNAGCVNIFRVSQRQTGTATAEEPHEHLLELYLYAVKGLNKGGLHHAIQLSDDLTQVGIRFFQVIHLRGQVLVPFHSILVFRQCLSVHGSQTPHMVFTTLNLFFQVFGKNLDFRQIRGHCAQRQGILPGDIFIIHEVHQTEVIFNTLFQCFQTVVPAGDFKLSLRKHTFSGNNALLMDARIFLGKAQLLFGILQCSFDGNGLIGNIGSRLRGFRAFFADLIKFPVHLRDGFFRGINAVFKLLLLFLAFQAFVLILTKPVLGLGNGFPEHGAAHIPMLNLILQLGQLYAVDTILRRTALHTKTIAFGFRSGDLFRHRFRLLFMLFQLSGGIPQTLLLKTNRLRQPFFLNSKLIQFFLRLVHSRLQSRTVGGFFFLTGTQSCEFLFRGIDIIFASDLLFP